jgi:hypothetical protein
MNEENNLVVRPPNKYVLHNCILTVYRWPGGISYHRASVPLMMASLSEHDIKAGYPTGEYRLPALQNTAFSMTV